MRPFASLSPIGVMPQPPANFANAGAGASRINAGTLSVPYPAAIGIGDVVFAQLAARSVTGTPGVSPPTGWSLVQLDAVSISQQWVFARIIDGTEGAAETFTFGTGTGQRAGRMYRITNSLASGTFYEASAGLSGSSSTTITAPSVTSLGIARRGLCFVYLGGIQALANFTGETGGDWAEAVAEYSIDDGVGTPLTLQLQTCDLSASLAAIAGGTMSITSAFWLTRALAVLPR